jgi:hypothetical protein
MHEARLHVLADDLRAWQDKRRQYRRHGDRHQQRSGKGDNVSKAQRHHQPTFHTGEKEERHEHQHDDQGRKHDGALDLAGGIENHLQNGVLFAFGLGQVLPQTPDDVLHHDDGVVHQGTKGNRHAAQGHGVDGGPERLHRQDGSDQRQGDGHQGDQRGAGRQQEGEDDGNDQDGPVAQGDEQVVDRGFG